MLRSDLTLLLRAAFGYLPLSMLAVGDRRAGDDAAARGLRRDVDIVSSATGVASTRFVAQATGRARDLSARSPDRSWRSSSACSIVAAALVLWIELLMREAAVYVIVLMLPLAFAAMVWPARRIWAIRAVELLVAL